MTENSSVESPRYQALLQLLRTADTIWNASRVFFSHWDLSPSQFNVLNLLGGTPEGRSQIELGRLLLTHRSNITGLVDRLEKRGWVQRLDDAQDRRAFRVVLTPAGQRLLDEILPRYHASAERVWGGISAQRAEDMVKELAEITACVEQEAASLKHATLTPNRL